MQRICPVPGGIKSYIEHPDQLLSAQTRRCPLCDDGHNLALHCWYERWAVLPDPEGTHRIRIRRLLCAATRRTVSLLPDLCIPRRQHGPAVLGGFFEGLVQGLSLLAALRRVRREAPCHAVAQSLVHGFLGRGAALRAYLAGCQARAPDPPAGVSPARGELAALFWWLTSGWSEAAAAFRHHGRRLHEQCGLGLA